MKFWVLLLVIWISPAFGDDLCAELLWSKYRAFPALDELIANADHELPFIGPDDEIYVGGPIYTHSVRQLFRRDAVLMELAYVKPGAVDPALVGRKAFAPLIVAHENLRRLADALKPESILPESPSFRQRFTGRPQFARRTELLWETREALYPVFAYWAVFNKRLRGELADGTMWRRLRAIDDDLKERAEELYRRATTVERRDPRYVILARIIGDWRTHATARRSLPYLLPFEHEELRERTRELLPLDGYERALLRARALRERRAQFRVIR